MALPRRHGSRRVGCLLGVVFVVLTGAQLARAIPDSEPTPTHPCAAVRCAADGEPVCGINCVTYPNACRATCSLVPAFTPGKCKDDCGETGPCVCTKELNPVCGSDCVTYSNPCFAFKCGKVPYANPGSCTKDCMPEPPACPCTKELKPVCGSDCVTYNNPCLAKCAKVKSYKDGKCPKKCVPEKHDDGTKFCPLIFDPVCDVEACKTYSNACFAGLAKAGKTEPGECPEDCEPVVKPPKVTPPPCRKEGRPCSPGNKYKDCCSGLKCKGGKCVKKYNNKPDWKHKRTDRSD